MPPSWDQPHTERGRALEQEASSQRQAAVPSAPPRRSPLGQQRPCLATPAHPADVSIERRTVLLRTLGGDRPVTGHQRAQGRAAGPGSPCAAGRTVGGHRMSAAWSSISPTQEATRRGSDQPSSCTGGFLLQLHRRLWPSMETARAPRDLRGHSCAVCPPSCYSSPGLGDRPAAQGLAEDVAWAWPVVPVTAQ